MAKAYQVKQVLKAIKRLTTSGRDVEEQDNVKKPLHGSSPPELHRQLAQEAAESGVSLNRLASDKLVEFGANKISGNKNSPKNQSRLFLLTIT